MADKQTLEEILKTESSEEFRRIRDTLNVHSFFKYGPIKINFGEHLVDAMASAEKCLQKYRATGNKEYLCDASNYLEFEFMYPSIPHAFFDYTSADESAGIAGESINQMKEKGFVFNG